MKRIISKAVVCVIVFILALFVTSGVFNNGNEEMTASMAEASLPLVHINMGGISYNYLHGLRQTVQGSFLRDTVTPLGEGRTLSFVIDKYGNDISGISFEVRSVDDSRLVESTRVTGYRESGDRIYATVTIKDLIEEDTEYNWILLLEVGGETIRYYTRIIEDSGFYLYEKLSYVRDFHAKTFDKELARQLATYLEPNTRGDNTTLSYVDIHSSLNQVSWDSLNVEEIVEPQISVREIESQTASIRMDYRVQTTEGKTVYQYNVSEFFRIRYGTERMYLLDYERTMNQIFDPEADVYASNKIMLGIRDHEVHMMESDGGSNLAFVNENQLFCYHAADKKLAYLFSFYDDLDLRTIYNEHAIKILSVDETGNVRFIVYGYMNRGKHEGNIGIQVYEYNGMLNTVEELIFIPYDKSFAALKADVEQLSYINRSGMLYLYLDGSILGINLTEKMSAEIADNLQQGSFQISNSDKMLVWQNSADAYDCTKLILMNLNTGETEEIKSEPEDRLLPLGFINEDLIYGVAHYEDIYMDFTGSVTFPMYVVYIQNERGETLHSYRREGIYVTGAEITDNLITLSRLEKSETDGYTEIAKDQIVNRVVEEQGYNSSEVVVTQTYEKIVQLVLKNSIEVKQLKHTRPMEVLYEGSRELPIAIESPVNRFYVYGKDGIMGTFTHEADAVNMAYDVRGVVADEKGAYIWKRSSRSVRNQIMAISGRSCDEQSTDLAVCLETILEYEGITKNVQPMLDKGKTAKQILQESLEGARLLELRGVSLDAVLYYVNQDIPVLASLEGERAVLVIGFNELNIVIMNPQTGTIYKIGMNDATKLFQDNENSFLTYLK